MAVRKTCRACPRHVMWLVMPRGTASDGDVSTDTVSSTIPLVCTVASPRGTPVAKSAALIWRADCRTSKPCTDRYSLQPVSVRCRLTSWRR